MIVAVAWWYLAPTTLGGSTRYVVTSGTSMEPRFHTGDLAVVRPAHDYKVGQIVAYWSTMLHTVVLHRIHAIQGNRYLFKGDNNDFIDPIHPTRAELLGTLWLHIPRGGIYLNLLHKPVVAAILCAFLAAGLFVRFDGGPRRRRRRRGGPSASGRPRAETVKTPDQGNRRQFNPGAPFITAAAAALVCLVLVALAFSRPSHTIGVLTTPYTQQVTFGYSAHVAHGPVYPDGAITTGDPIFVRLVHHLNVQVAYRLVSDAPATVHGSEEILLHLGGPSGWHRDLVLTPRTAFTGPKTSTRVPLDIPQLESLVTHVESLIGPVSFGNFTIAIEPVITLHGTVAGQQISSTFAPAWAFQLQPGQLIPSSAASSAAGALSTVSSTSGVAQAAYGATRDGAITSPATTPTHIGAFGVSFPVETLRWLALLGLLLSSAAALIAFLRRRSEPFEESVRIQAQYGHMIVPIVAGEDLGWPPVDVPNIKALVRLAETGQRLILHNRSDGVDTYMVNDEGTVYRYQVRPSNVVWGEWSEAATPVEAAA